MDKSAQRLITTSFVVYLLALGVFVLYSLQQYPPQEVLDVFHRQWVVSNALYLFIDRLIPVQLFAIVVTFSLLLDTRRGAAPFFELVRPVLVVLIVGAFLYTIAVAFAEPALLRARHEAEHQSELAEAYRLDGEEALNAGDHARAVADFEAYLAIDPADDHVESKLEEAREQLTEAREDPARQQPEPPAGQEIAGRNVAQLLDQARADMNEEDYISAHYWARIARDLEPNNEEARRIVREANRRMASLELSNLAENERARYERKREAYQAWDNGEIFRAHRLFTALAERYPDDGDIERYLPEVEEALRDVAFFVDELEQNLRLPGSQDIVYVDGPREETGHRRFAYIGRLVTTADGTYARDVEILDVAANGEVVRHLRAGAAKLREGRFVLQGVRRGSEELVYRPAYRAAPADGGRPPYVNVAFAPGELHALRDTDARFASVGVADLMMMEEFFPRVGYSADGVRLALLMRLVSPFSFVILSFFAIAAGWAWRSRYIRRPPIPVLLLIPIVPVVLSILTTFYHYLQRVIIGALLPVGDFTPTLIAAVLIQALLLLGALAVLAGQSTS